MIPEQLTFTICRRLVAAGYEIVSQPDPPADGPVDAALVIEKDGVRRLLLVAFVTDDLPYFASADEKSEQQALRNQHQFARWSGFRRGKRRRCRESGKVVAQTFRKVLVNRVTRLASESASAANRST